MEQFKYKGVKKISIFLSIMLVLVMIVMFFMIIDYITNNAIDKCVEKGYTREYCLVKLS